MTEILVSEIQIETGNGCGGVCECEEEDEEGADGDNPRNGRNGNSRSILSKRKSNHTKKLFNNNIIIIGCGNGNANGNGNGNNINDQKEQQSNNHIIKNVIENNIKESDKNKTMANGNSSPNGINLWLERFRAFQRELTESALLNQESTTSDVPNLWNVWDEPSQILDFLYLGSKNAANLEVLKRKQIKSVVNCCSLDFKPKYPLYISAIFLKALDHKSYKISQHFEETYEFIEKSRMRGEKVLIHCVAGISRSVSIVIAYLMRRFLWDFFTSFAFVVSKRPVADPNDGFACELKAFERILMAKRIIQSSSKHTS